MPSSSCRVAAILGATLAASACDGDGVVCPAGIAPAVVVEIRDAFDDAALAAGARGSASEGTYVDSLVPHEAAGNGVLFSLAAAYGRAGTYRVEVVHPGYAPWEQAGVRVSEDVCEVETVRLRASLVRQP